MEDFGDFIWFVSFTISLICLNVLCNVIRNYIANQAPGSLSLFVSTVRDVNTCAQIQGSIHCLLGLLSRFELIETMLRSQLFLTDFICILYEIASTSNCVNLCAFCIIRMLCMWNVSFMEETIGEKKMRSAVGCVCLFSSVTVCALLIYSGEIEIGSVFSLATRQGVPGGPIRQILHPFIYICVASSYLIMEAYIKWKTQLQNIDSIEGETKNMNKSGPISFSITLAFVIHTLSDFILPKLIKGNEYYLAKILISNMIFYIILPSIIIWFNPNIHKYVQQKLRKKFSVFQKRTNQVSPCPSALNDDVA